MNYFPMERNRYFYGKLLSVHDFQTEQNYNIRKRCLLNRIVQGGGVLCGLGVTVDNDSTLVIGSGMALDYEGREIALEKPLLRKIQMIDGYEKLGQNTDAWLCLTYSEENIEPVNSVPSSSSDDQQSGCQYNMVQEGFALSVTSEMPDYETLLQTKGYENVNVIYNSDELTLVLCAPSCTYYGDDFSATVLVVKNEQTPPVQFTLEGKNNFAQTAEGCLLMDYHESAVESRKVYFVDLPVQIQQVRDLSASLFPEGAELNIELGSHHYRSHIVPDVMVRLVKNEEEQKNYYEAMDSLDKNLIGTGLPVYLAKLGLIRSAGTAFVGNVTNLPFGQAIKKETAEENHGAPDVRIETSVRSLEYWQKPEVNGNWDRKNQKITFDFGIPSAEQYDYSVSHGTVDIPLPGGNHVEARYYSDEVSFGLGPGSADIRLSIQFENEQDGSCLLVGNHEVFNKNKDVPKVETAAIVYPERGTMKIGVWLHDDVRGNVIRVHYFAVRPSLDSSTMTANRKVSLSIVPQMIRLGYGEQTALRAQVTGSENKEVQWKVLETDGGNIDINGIYTAPHKQGTYEVEAVSLADTSVSARAFVIVD